MNRKFKNIIAFLTLAIFTLSLVACKKPTVEERAKYVVSFNTDGGSQIIDEVVSEGDRATRPEDPTKEGYTFIDWYKESTLIRVWDFQVEQIYSSTTIHAKWEKDKVVDVRYTVKFESNGGTKLQDLNIKENNKIYKPEDPLKANYVFKGWYKERTLLNEWNFSSDFVVSDITLYAKWIDSDKETLEFTVSFESNGGTDVVDRVVDANQLVNKPNDPTKPNHKFIGWYKNEELTNIWNFKTDIVTTDIKLFAKWEEVATEYRVNFNSNGGTIVTSKNVKEDNLIDKPNDPTKTNFVFKGWYKEEGLVNEWNFEVDKVVRDITLYAKWEEGTSEGWDLINNSNLIDILNSSNLNLFNKDKYVFDLKIDGSLVNVDSRIFSKGTIDLSDDYLNRKNALEYTYPVENASIFLHQTEGIYYVTVIENDEITDERFILDIADNDPLKVFTGASFDDLNILFETFLLALASHEEVVNSSNISLYKKGSSYKVDFNLNDETVSPAILNAFFAIFNIGSNYNNFIGNMGFSILLEQDEITSIDFGINGEVSDETIRTTFNVSKTNKIAEIPDYVKEVEYENTTLLIDVYLENGDVRTVAIFGNTFYTSTVLEIMKMSGIIIDKLYFDSDHTNRLPNSFNRDLITDKKIYGTLKDNKKINEIIDDILDSNSYTLDFNDNYSELLVTNDYSANGNYLFNKDKDKVLLDNMGNIIEVNTSDLLNPIIKFDIKKYLNKSMIESFGYYIFLGAKDSFLIYDSYNSQFTYYFKSFDESSFYMDYIMFTVTSINETIISEDFINNFTEEETDDNPISINIYNSEDFIYHDLDKSNYPDISGILLFENQVIEISNFQDLLKYNIAYEVVSYDYFDDGVFTDNVEKYIFYYNEEVIGFITTISYESSRGSIVMNPKYFNQELYEEFYDEAIYYYVNELNVLPDWNFEVKDYNYKYTFRNRFIETVEDLKGFSNSIISLKIYKLYKNKAILFEQFTKNLISVSTYNVYDNKIDIVNGKIYASDISISPIIMHIDGIPYFKLSDNNSYSELYVEYNNENIKIFINESRQNYYKELYDIYLSLSNINNYTLNGFNLDIDGFGRFKYNDDIFVDNSTGHNFTLEEYYEKEHSLDSTVNIVGITKVFGKSKYAQQDIIRYMINDIREVLYKYEFYLDEELTEKIDDNNQFHGLREQTIYYSDSESYNNDFEYMFDKINAYNSYTLKSENLVIKVGEQIIEFTYTWYNKTYNFVLDKVTNNSYLLIDSVLVESEYKGVFNLSYIVNNYEHLNKYYDARQRTWEYSFRFYEFYYDIIFLDDNNINIRFYDYNNSEYNGISDYHEYFEITDINNTKVDDYDFNNVEKDEITSIEFSYDTVFNYNDFLQEFDLILNYKYSASIRISNYNIKRNYDYTIEKEGNIINFTINIEGVVYEILGHELNILKPTNIELSYDGTFVNMSRDNNYSFHLTYDGSNYRILHRISELEAVGINVEINPTSHDQLFEYIFYYDGEIMNKILIVHYYLKISNILVNPKFDMRDINDEVAYWYINELKELPILYYIEGIYLIDTTFEGHQIENLDHLKSISKYRDIIRLNKHRKYNDTKSYYEYISKQKIRIRDFNNGYNSYTIDLINKKITSDSEHELKYFEGNYYFIYNGYPWNYTKSYLEYNEDNIDKYLNNEEKLYYEKMYELFNIFNNVKNFKVERNKIVIEGLDEFKNVTEYFSGENYHVGFEQPIYEIDENFIVELDGLETSLYTIINLDYFNRIIDQIRMSYPYIERFYIDEDDFENKWLDELRTTGKVKLNYTYKESYYVDLEKIIDEINSYDSYTFTNYNDIFKVGKDVIEYTTTENNKEVKYVLDRKTQNVFYVNGNELVLTTFKNVFDLKYLTTNYETLTKRYQENRWIYEYNFDGYLYNISIIEERVNINLNIKKGLFHEFNYNLEISDINETSVEEYDFSNYSINSILDIKVSYNETGNYNQFINDLGLIIKFEHGNSLWKYNSNLPEEVTIDIMDRGRTVDLIIYYLDQTFKIIDLRIYDGHSDYINFYTNNGYKIMYLDEFVNINSMAELNKFLIKDYTALADFDGWGNNDYYFSDFEILKNYILNTSEKHHYFNYNSVVLEHRFSYFIEKFRDGEFSFILNGINIYQNYSEFNFYLDENYHQVDFINRIYYVNYQLVDFELLDDDLANLAELLNLFYTNDLVSTNYKDNILSFGDDLKIERTENSEFIIYYKDIILKDIFN